jgi:type II secretory pathway pseudopilin PulG
VTHRKKFRFESHTLKSCQDGAVLMLMMFILGLGTAAFILKSLNTSNLQSEQNDKTYQALKEAKTALISWSAAHPYWPGIMPFPDRKETSNPNYDGKSDCVTNGLNVSHLLGKLPLSGDAPCITPQQGLSVELIDSESERLWYATSMNLIRTNGANSTPVINPGIANAPLHPWLKVLDRNGNLISDRVAVVIIAPGAPLAGQNRSSSAPNPSEYLDSFKIGANVYSNADYDNFDEDFIMGEDSRHLSSVDTSLAKPYYFNDKLIYITIDELMAALENRALQEARQQLKNYYLTSNTLPDNRFYPYAAKLGETGNMCKEGELSGLLPMQPASASCTSNQTCSLSFSTTQVIFTTNSPFAYSSSTGACSDSGSTCTCTGAGSCSTVTPPAKAFTCADNGVCTSSGASPAGSFTFTYIPNSPDVTDVTGACTGGNGSVTCTGSGDFSSPRSSCSDSRPGLANLPRWFTVGLWQHYIYYSIASDCTSAVSGCKAAGLTVGARNNVDAVVIAAGSTLGKTTAKPTVQVRPSNNVIDYLDSIENTDNDFVYDGAGTPRNSTYNDQVIIVAP